MRSLANRPISRRLFATAALVGGVACASGQEIVQTPFDELPPYTESEQAIFNDAIAPEVFGLEVDRGAFEEEPHFVEAAQFSDHILRAKLKTVTADRLGDQQRYRIVLQPLGTPIVGHPLTQEIELMVGRASPSINLLRTMASGVVGRTTVIFLREYRLDEQRVLHFRAEPDSDAVIAAVRAARSSVDAESNQGESE